MHFGFEHPFFACPIGRASKIAHPKIRGPRKKFVHSCLCKINVLEDFRVNQTVTNQGVDLLLSSNHNKNMLVKFIVDQWKTKCHALERKVLLTTCGTKAYRIISEAYLEWTCWNQIKKKQTLIYHTQK